MRKNNIVDMTVVEQIVKIREDICIYACRYREQIYKEHNDKTMRLISMQQYCHECPLMKLHYTGRNNDRC